MEVQYSASLYQDLRIDLFPAYPTFLWLFASLSLLAYGLPVSQSVVTRQMLKGYSQVNLQLN